MSVGGLKWQSGYGFGWGLKADDSAQLSLRHTRCGSRATARLVVETGRTPWRTRPTIALAVELQLGWGLKLLSRVACHGHMIMTVGLRLGWELKLGRPARCWLPCGQSGYGSAEG